MTRMKNEFFRQSELMENEIYEIRQRAKSLEEENLRVGFLLFLVSCYILFF